MEEKKVTKTIEILRTSNYRRHIAIWEINNDRLFLKEIQVEASTYNPEKYNVKSKTDTVFCENLVFADWFNGVLECHLVTNWETKVVYYFYVKNGNIVNMQMLTNSDFDRIAKEDTIPEELMDKYHIYRCYENYIAYYLRLNNKDTIIMENEGGGYLRGNFDMSPLLLYYANDHIQFPYNWENFEKNGSPHCQWIIEDEEIYLTKINLYSGLDIFEIEKDTVHLNSLFSDKVHNNRVFCDWISGIYTIEYGESTEFEFQFEASKYTYLRIKNGIVTEIYTIPSDSDLSGIPDGLKILLKELNKDKYERFERFLASRKINKKEKRK